MEGRKTKHSYTHTHTHKQIQTDINVVQLLEYNTAITHLDECRVEKTLLHFFTRMYQNTRTQGLFYSHVPEYPRTFFTPLYLITKVHGNICLAAIVKAILRNDHVMPYVLIYWKGYALKLSFFCWSSRGITGFKI